MITPAVFEIITIFLAGLFGTQLFQTNPTLSGYWVKKIAHHCSVFNSGRIVVSSLIGLLLQEYFRSVIYLAFLCTNCANLMHIEKQTCLAVCFMFEAIKHILTKFDIESLQKKKILPNMFSVFIGKIKLLLHRKLRPNFFLKNGLLCKSYYSKKTWFLRSLHFFVRVFSVVNIYWNRWKFIYDPHFDLCAVYYFRSNSVICVINAHY